MTSDLPRFDRRSLIIGSIAGAALLPLQGYSARAAAPAETLEYHSDYVSFIGRDVKGVVYFALDTNRGRSGDDYQAEHFVIGYADGEGFLKLDKTGPFPNSTKELRTIPRSDFFAFLGHAETGIRLMSPVNGLELDAAPLEHTLDLKTRTGFYRVGACPATLRIKGRTIAGRMTYEALFYDGWNRFVRDYSGPWRNFNGLYLLTDDGHDLYVRSQDFSRTMLPESWLAGFATWQGHAALSNIDFKITEFAAAKTSKGRYARFNWPADWSVGFDYAGHRFRLELATRTRGLNWIWNTNGFEMAIVDGRIRSETDGSARKVTGWAEIIM